MSAPAVGLRLTLKHILFTTDFTSVSENAMPYALAMARLYGSKIFVTHAVGPEPPLAIPLEPVPVEMDPHWQDARRNLAQVLETGAIRTTVREGILEQGNLREVIEDIIQRHTIDLVVLGSHGRHGLKKLVLGSSAEEIFRTASCPVMTVGPRASSNETKSANFRQILFATDFSQGSLNALPYALSLAEENQAELTLLHFIPMVPSLHQDMVRAEGENRLRALIPPDAEDWCKPHCVVAFEFPAEGILALAAERNADLIVMGVRARGARSSAHLPWAIAYEVVCHAPCPVLTVRG